jgi:hypothetical protein
LVSNDEIKRRLKNHNNNSTFLVCDSCKGRYELQKGESIEDFESCSCGGKLRYENISYNTIKTKKSKSNQKLGIIILGSIGILILGFILIISAFTPSDTTSSDNNTNNSLTTVSGQEKLVGSYTLNGRDRIAVSLPNGVEKVRVEYINLDDSTHSRLGITSLYTLNYTPTIPPQEQDMDMITDYIEYKTIDTSSASAVPISNNITLDAKKATCLFIKSVNTLGTLNVYAIF